MSHLSFNARPPRHQARRGGHRDGCGRNRPGPPTLLRPPERSRTRSARLCGSVRVRRGSDRFFPVVVTERSTRLTPSRRKRRVATRAGALRLCAPASGPTSRRRPRDHAAKLRPRIPENVDSGQGEHAESGRHVLGPRPTRSSCRGARRSRQLLAACPRSIAQVGQLLRDRDERLAPRCRRRPRGARPSVFGPVADGAECGSGDNMVVGKCGHVISTGRGSKDPTMRKNL